MKQLSAIAAIVVATATLTATAEDVTVDAGRGPVNLHLPTGYDPAVPMPLIVSLHGYGGNGFWHEDYMQFTPLSDDRGFLLAMPDGQRDLFGFNYWNGTDACCDFFGNSDDSGYLRNLVETIEAEYSVDPKRIYFTGHSNGGFMSHRMACDHADKVAGIASLAGATWEDPIDCSPSEPVHMLQIHGSADTVIQFGGSCLFGAGCYPSAPATTGQWAVHNGCDLQPELVLPPRDLVTEVAGGDTVGIRFDSNCLPGGSSELWAIFGGFHSPGLTANFSPELIDHLLARPKP